MSAFRQAQNEFLPLRPRRAAGEAYPFDYNGNKLRITVSIGIVLFDQNTGLEGSLLLADKALYRSKENGRNQITVWTPDLK